LMHADKLENGDELVRIETQPVENLTVEKLLELIGTPSREREGYGVLLVFKKRNGVECKFLGEAMKLSVDRLPVFSAGDSVKAVEFESKAPVMEPGMGMMSHQDPSVAMLTGSA
jgi:hypothetical protein